MYANLLLMTKKW